MIQGDLLFVYEQLTHSVFKRVGNDLFTSIDISLQEALLGFERPITHLDGHQVIVRSSPKTIA
jgi:DnaJ-class molecular chaperone